jgi:hypothetical protein
MVSVLVACKEGSRFCFRIEESSAEAVAGKKSLKKSSRAVSAMKAIRLSTSCNGASLVENRNGKYCLTKIGCLIQM